MFVSGDITPLSKDDSREAVSSDYRTLGREFADEVVGGTIDEMRVAALGGYLSRELVDLMHQSTVTSLDRCLAGLVNVGAQPGYIEVFLKAFRKRSDRMLADFAENMPPPAAVAPH